MFGTDGIGHNGSVHIVSTDGSCLKNPGGAIGWAWVDHNGRRFDSGGAASGTNQIAELRALLEAISAYPGEEPLLIESDSQYAIRCATEWLPGWKRKGWRTASGSPVSNLELIKAIDNAIAARPGPVRFRWVRGHVGNVFNERADELAGAAARDWAEGRGVSGRLFAEAAVGLVSGQGATGSAQGAPGSVSCETLTGSMSVISNAQLEADLRENVAPKISDGNVKAAAKKKAAKPKTVSDYELTTLF